MDASLEKKVIECLDALEQGQPVDQILARYPETADQLRPILLTAVHLSQLRLQPSLAAQAKSRKTFLAQAEEQQQPTSRATLLGRWRQRLVPLVSLMVVLLLLGVGVVSLSTAAVPGDPLYGSKRLVEGIRLSLTTGTSARTTLVEQFQQERIREIEALLQTGRETAVEFEGVIEAVEGKTWVIAGLSTHINEDTQIEGIPAIGREAHVIGRTGEEGVVATAVTITGNGQPLPVPTTEPEATAAVRPTATATATQTVLATPTPEATDTTPATMTATSQATATPTTELTATPNNPPSPPPPSDDNENDDDENGQDNDNDNDNDNDDGDDGDDDDGDDDNDNEHDRDNDNDDDEDDDNDNDD